MGHLNQREKEILRLLAKGMTTSEIGRKLGISNTSVSRYQRNIRLKALDIEEDLEFMLEVGYVQFRNNRLQFLTRDRDPRVLRDSAHQRGPVVLKS